MSNTPISQLGEFGLIDRVTASFPRFSDQVIMGVGDDAAVIRGENGQAYVLTTDLLLEGVHFDLAYVPLRHLGYKSVVVNLSDIAAMNARPIGVTVSIAISNRFPVEAVDEIYEGIKLACERYKIDLLGGDTSSSRQGLLISVTAIGQAREDQIVYRKGAQPKDLICVSGDVGGAYAGFLVLDREKQVFLDQPEMQPDITDYDYVVGRQLKPEARLDVLEKLAGIGLKPSAMMDISDGIASELHHLCRQSHCGATIYAGKLPIDFQTVAVAEEFKIAPATFALNGGEDYELIFTVPIQTFEQVRTLQEITIIGHMTEDPGIIQIVLDSGEAVDIEAQGWEHFKNSETDQHVQD
jgi:thiamine-monophosphate kinase